MRLRGGKGGRVLPGPGWVGACVAFFFSSLRVSLDGGGRDELFEASPFFPLALRFQRAALRRGSCGPKTIHLKSGRKPRFTCVYLTTAGQSEHGRQTRRRWEQSLCRGSPRFSTALNLGAQRARPPSAERAAPPRKAVAAPGLCDCREQRGEYSGYIP